MERVPVESSVLASVGWENNILEVAFKTGSVYRYFNVPRDYFERLLAADSKGRFFNKTIKGRFRYKNIQ